MKLSFSLFMKQGFFGRIFFLKVEPYHGWKLIKKKNNFCRCFFDFRLRFFFHFVNVSTWFLSHGQSLSNSVCRDSKLKISRNRKIYPSYGADEIYQNRIVLIIKIEKKCIHVTCWSHVETPNGNGNKSKSEPQKNVILDIENVCLLSLLWTGVQNKALDLPFLSFVSRQYNR